MSRHQERPEQQQEKWVMAEQIQQSGPRFLPRKERKLEDEKDNEGQAA